MHRSAWTKADLHVHTNYSDGGHDIPTLLGHIADHTDIAVLAITDHDCIVGAFEAHRMAPEFGLDVVIGQEVSTTRGHVLGLYLHEHVPAGLSIPQTVALIHEQGGLAVLAHPCDRMTNSPMRYWPRPTAEEWAAFGVDALEGCNGCQLDPQASVRAIELGQRLNLPLTGGSDAHHKEALGTGYTLFPGRTAQDLRRAIELGTCRCAGAGWAPREYLGWITLSWWPRAYQGLQRTALNLSALHL